MSSQRLTRPIQCIITALELIGLNEPSMPPTRVRKVLALVERHLGDKITPAVDRAHLSLTGRHVLRIAPTNPTWNLPFTTLLRMVHLQADLVALGVLVRGAITIGDAGTAGAAFFGKGIAEAERLRDEVALVPRVVVHPDLLRGVELNADLRAEQHTPMEELGYLRRLLRWDADGLWFIDHLRAIESEMDSWSQYLEHLGEHQRLVIRRLEASTVLDRCSHAWSWLWRYHNLVLEDLKNRSPLKDPRIADLRIPASSPLVYSFPPSAKLP